MTHFYFVTLKIQVQGDMYEGEAKKAILNALHRTIVNPIREDSGLTWVEVKE